jgi:hypothetical protein
LHYTIYKTTNLINGKIYIGKHKTNNPNDDYPGSGTDIRKAIIEYGRENFKKEILFIFETSDEMDEKEAEIVTSEFVLREDNYNICPGGKGGWALDAKTRSEISSKGGKVGSSVVNAQKQQFAQEKMKLVEHIDFSKRGWIGEVIKILGITHAGARYLVYKYHTGAIFKR